MKRYLFFSLLFLMLLNACKKEQTVNLTGTIQNYDNAPLLLFDNKVSDIPDTVPVNNGIFNMTLSIENPVFMVLKHDRFRKTLFLEPGNLLKIKFNANNPDSTFKLDGKGSFENWVLDSVAKGLESIDYGFIFKNETVPATQYIDSTFKASLDLLNRLINQQDLSPLFIEYEKISLESQAASLKTVLAMRKNIKDSTYYSFFNDIDLEQDKYLDVPEYRELLSYYTSYKAQTSLSEKDQDEAESPDAWLVAVIETIEQFKNNKVKEYLIFSEINSYLNYYGLKNFSKYKEYLTNNITNSDYINEFQKNYEKKLLIAPGKPAPEFTCTDIDSNLISLNNFKGKYVYIDFWATWCGPCRHELPEYIRLHSEYKGKDIAFVSISLDENKKNWEKSILEHKPEYISLIAENGWNSKVSKAYQISGIPTFVLIDREGKIIDTQAPRPSSDLIRPTIDKLLEDNQ